MVLLYTPTQLLNEISTTFVNRKPDPVSFIDVFELRGNLVSRCRMGMTMRDAYSEFSRPVKTLDLINSVSDAFKQLIEAVFSYNFLR